MEIQLSIRGVSDIELTLSAMTPQEAQAMLMRLAAQVLREETRAAKRARPQYEVRLVAHGDSKIECIKTIREHLGLSLIDAKHASEADPHVILRTEDHAKADGFAKALRACGAIAEFGVAA